MGDQSFMGFIALFKLGMVIFYGRDEQNGKQKERDGEDKVDLAPQGREAFKQVCTLHRVQPVCVYCLPVLYVFWK